MAVEKRPQRQSAKSSVSSSVKRNNKAITMKRATTHMSTFPKFTGTKKQKKYVKPKARRIPGHLNKAEEKLVILITANSTFSIGFETYFTGPNGERYFSAEHYQMHSKALIFGDIEAAARILCASSRSEMMAQGSTISDRVVLQSWNDDCGKELWTKHFRSQVTLEANYLKYTSCKKLKAKLLATKNRELIDKSYGDRAGGPGLVFGHKERMRFGSGSNFLGRTLMKVRNQIRDEERGLAKWEVASY